MSATQGRGRTGAAALAPPADWEHHVPRRRWVVAPQRAAWYGGNSWFLLRATRKTPRRIRGQSRHPDGQTRARTVGRLHREQAPSSQPCGRESLRPARRYGDHARLTTGSLQQDAGCPGADVHHTTAHWYRPTKAVSTQAVIPTAHGAASPDLLPPQHWHGMPFQNPLLSGRGMHQPQPLLVHQFTPISLRDYLLGQSIKQDGTCSSCECRGWVRTNAGPARCFHLRYRAYMGEHISA